jgi:hypothetical protein
MVGQQPLRGRGRLAASCPEHTLHFSFVCRHVDGDTTHVAEMSVLDDYMDRRSADLTTEMHAHGSHRALVIWDNTTVTVDISVRVSKAVSNR